PRPHYMPGTLGRRRGPHPRRPRARRRHRACVQPRPGGVARDRSRRLGARRGARPRDRPRRHRDAPETVVKPVGVLVMAHGTPRSLDDLGAFYTEIRRGSPPPDDLLADLERRYRATRGTSPLNERTSAQVDGIRRALEQRAPGRFVVAAGAKFAPPRISDALRSLGRAGVGRVVGLVLAPHYSVASVGDYTRRARDAAGALGPDEGGPLDVEMMDQLPP